jgi:hypothetical protein
MWKGRERAGGGFSRSRNPFTLCLPVHRGPRRVGLGFSLFWSAQDGILGVGEEVRGGETEEEGRDAMRCDAVRCDATSKMKTTTMKWIWS